MISAKRPSRDPVQIFCTNFPSHKDLTKNPSYYLQEINWPKPQNEDIELRISRYTLEVLDLVTSGKAEKEGLTNLIYAVLELYGPSPVAMICNSSKIASALVKSGLYDDDHNELEQEISESIANWRDKAVEACRMQYPELTEFQGETAYTMLHGGIRWAPTRWIAEFRSSTQRNS